MDFTFRGTAWATPPAPFYILKLCQWELLWDSKRYGSFYGPQKDFFLLGYASHISPTQQPVQLLGKKI